MNEFAFETLEEKLARELRANNEQKDMIRSLMWIAFVWNDHNFSQTPSEAARETLAKYGIENLAQANCYLDRLSDNDKTSPSRSRQRGR